MNNIQLATALRTTVSNLQRRLRKQMYSADELSMAELDTLAHLLHQPTLLPSELAKLTKVKPQSMTKVLHRLEAAQLIARTPQPEDKRKVAVSLTEAGRQFGAQIRHERDEWLRQMLDQHLTAAQIQTLVAALPVLAQLADAS